MRSLLQQTVHNEFLAFEWVDHGGEVTIGPLLFPPDIPIPLPASSDGFTTSAWLHLPYPGRPLQSAYVTEEAPEGFSSQEILRALLGGHLTVGSQDYQLLSDMVGRCVLLHATFGMNTPWYKEMRDLFGLIREGAGLYDLLIHRAHAILEEADHSLQSQDGNHAIRHYLLGRVLLEGAHLLSPMSTGVLYEIGMVLYFIACKLDVADKDIEVQWLTTFGADCKYYLELSLADRQIRDQTLATYHLALIRERLGELDAAADAYQRFLKSPAASQSEEFSRSAQKSLHEIIARGN